MANIGRLTVDLRLTSQKFEAGLKKANASLTAFRGRANAAVKSMGGMQARIAALVGVAGFGAMISQSLKAGDAIAKMSDRLGISTENLTAFQHLAQLSGESIEGFDKSIEKMVRSIGEAQRGIGTGKQAFEDLGITVDQFAGKNADEQFLLIADAIGSLENETLQASLASDIFGRSGIKLLNTIRAGRDGFESAKDEVDKFGLSLSRVDAAKIEAANDAILRAQQAMKGASMQAAIQLSPLIEEVANQFVAAGTEGEGFAGKIRTALENGASFIGVFADGIRGIKVVLKAAEAGVLGFGAIWGSTMEFIINDVLVPFANRVTNFVLAPIREILEFGARFSDTAQTILDEVNQLGNAQGFETVANLAQTMRDNFNESRGELHDLMMETIPSEAMKEKIAEVFENAEERAKESAENVSRVYRESTNTSSDEDDGDGEKKTADQELQEKRTFLERVSNLEINNSKKLAAAKQAIKLKEVIQNKWKAISEAVASAPFPANVPAIAFAAAETVAAISGIKSAGSFEGGGFTGMGARVGGVDGRGGMPAIVHPNETIVDNTRSNGGNVVNNYNLNINARDDFQRPVSRRQVERGAYIGLRRATRMA